MLATRELFVSVAGLAVLTIISALHPSAQELSASPSNYLFGMISAFLATLPNFFSLFYEFTNQLDYALFYS